MLRQAGLGCRKIKLLADDTEESVLNKLTSDAKDENGNTVGFPQLRTFYKLSYFFNFRVEALV